jgi:hypothetical protein
MPSPATMKDGSAAGTSCREDLLSGTITTPAAGLSNTRGFQSALLYPPYFRPSNKRRFLQGDAE